MINVSGQSSWMSTLGFIALAPALLWSPARAQAASACDAWDAAAPATAPQAAPCGGTLKDGVYSVGSNGSAACSLTVAGKVDLVPAAGAGGQHLKVTVRDGSAVLVHGFRDARAIEVEVEKGQGSAAVCIEDNKVRYPQANRRFTAGGAIFIKLDEGREGAAVEIRDNLIIGPASSENSYSIAVKAKRERTLMKAEVAKQTFAATPVIIRHNAVVNSHTGHSETIALNGALSGIEVAHNLIYKYTNIGIDLMGGEPSYRGQPRGGDIHHNLVARYMEGENDTLGYALYSDGGADLEFRENLLYATAAGIEVSFEYEKGDLKGPLVVSGNRVVRNVVDYPVGACEKRLRTGKTCPDRRRISAKGVRFGLHKTKKPTYLGCNAASENHVYGLAERVVYTIELDRPKGYIHIPGSAPKMTDNYVYSGPGTSRVLAKPDPLSDPNCSVSSKQPATSTWVGFTPEKPVRNQLACALLVTGIDDAGGQSTVGPRDFDDDPDLMGARASLIAHYGCGQPAPAVAPSP